MEKAKGEMVRKGIHLLIAVVPALAAVHKHFAMALLAAGIVLYTACELLTLKGFAVPFFHRIAGMASRERDCGKFALGPVTLALGALLSLLVFPPVAAAVAVYALAFGDGFASLVGRIFGKTRPPVLQGKSIEGSIACFIAVYLSALHVSHNWLLSCAAAFIAAVVEALPLKDWDNIIIPLAAGYVASLFLG
jgi:dolichol kinase